MGFDFTVIAPLLPSHCGFSLVFGCGVSVGEFQCLPVDDCPAASCDSGVLARGSESTSFYSAILVPLPWCLLCIINLGKLGFPFTAQKTGYVFTKHHHFPLDMYLITIISKCVLTDSKKKRWVTIFFRVRGGEGALNTDLLSYSSGRQKSKICLSGV